jgi:hypothetical protein
LSILQQVKKVLVLYDQGRNDEGETYHPSRIGWPSRVEPFPDIRSGAEAMVRVENMRINKVFLGMGQQD